MDTYNIYKYQGTGNDFVILDNRTNFFDKTNLDLVKRMCDRKFGIGADGLILIEDHPKYDFELIYFNSDGTQSFCGNGSRCGVAFAHKLQLIKHDTTFSAIDGVHKAKLEGDLIHLEMGNVSRIKHINEDNFLFTGSPHYIRYTDDIDAIDLIKEAHTIRYNKHFKEKGTNVNFVQPSEDGIAIRTYERGVEDETLSCGTGATAAALSAHVKYELPSPIKIKVKGGELSIAFEQKSNGKFHNIWLIGPATHVFTALIEL